MLQLILLSCLLSLAMGGTFCPPRTAIYPCTCVNVIPRKNHIFTIVTCQKLDDSDLLENIMPALGEISIDQFHLVDSYWNAHLLGREEKKGLPENWVSLLRVKEYHIMDTTFTQCFACNLNTNCRNVITTRFKVTNSSSAEKMCTMCDSGQGPKAPWTGCMNKIKEFHFNHGKLTSLGADLFPHILLELEKLDFSHNHIVRVDVNSFKNLPNLVHLDLSNNAMEYFHTLFGTPMTKLEHLDLSSNHIKTVRGEFFTLLPALKVFNGSSNRITGMERNVWTQISSTLRTIDLSHNEFNCTCQMKWINSTYDAGLGLSGTCALPAEYLGSPIRRVSRYLSERCDRNGNLGTRRPRH